MRFARHACVSRLGRDLALWHMVAVILLLAPAHRLHASEPAQQADARLKIELNVIEPVDDGCRITLLMGNEIGAGIDALAFELALFDAVGRVSGLVTLDAGALPAGKNRVKRFALPGLSCDNIARILFNDVTRCEGDRLSPETCLARLEISSKAGLDFIR